MKYERSSTIEALRNAILQFGENHPDATRHYVAGQRIIHQGGISDECFLLKEGTLRVLARHGTEPEIEITLRHRGELVGETAFLQRNAPRTASVEVVSADAQLIRLTRKDLFSLIAQHQSIKPAIARLWELAASRSHETGQILDGNVHVQSHMMSALLADVHSFTALGEVVWEEHLDSFLFNFLERSYEIASQHNGSFEDQGDGFKVLFDGADHAADALQCAMQFDEMFRVLRDAWCSFNDAFENIGMGIGICSDLMSVRRREGSGSRGRVLSHAINVAAAMSKYRTVPRDVDVFIDENTYSLTSQLGYSFDGPKQNLLEKLGRIQTVYRVHDGPSSRPQHVAVPARSGLPVGSAFISYAHADAGFVDRLVDRLERDGVRVWRDEKEILVGDVIDKAVSEGIQGNWIFLLVLTPNSVGSNWVARELDEAFHEEAEGRKVVLPVLAGKLEPEQIPTRARRKKSVTFGDDFDTPYAQLRESIEGHLRRHAKKTAGTA